MCLMGAGSETRYRAEGGQKILGGKGRERFIGQEENFTSDAWI